MVSEQFNKCTQSLLEDLRLIAHLSSKKDDWLMIVDAGKVEYIHEEGTS